MKRLFAKWLGLPPDRTMYPKKLFPVWEFVEKEGVITARIYWADGPEEKLFQSQRDANKWVHTEFQNEVGG